jgi:triphosphoribosyl-dephospho-CoA synthase
MRSQYGITGAIEEVASGFKTVMDVALPTYIDIYAQTANAQQAAIQSLFSLMAYVQDTNIVWRGGLSALYIVQDLAKQFLAVAVCYNTIGCKTWLKWKIISFSIA